MSTREERGRAIAERCRIEKLPTGYKVPSQTGSGFYVVRQESGYPVCSCPDYEERMEKCKHCWAVEFSMSKVEQNADGSTTVSTVSVKAERKTYAQPDWSAYHAHQVNERRHFLALLGNLCDTCANLPAKSSPKGGRPPIPMRDAIFAAIFKVYSLTSARRFSGELAEAHEAGHIGECPHFNSVLNVFDKEETTAILREMIRVSALPLASVEKDWAVDSTGFATITYASWCDHKHGGVEKKKAKFVKAHFITGVKTNVVPAVDILDQHANDCPQLPGLVNATAKDFTIREVSADKAYPATDNFNAVANAGGQFFPAFKDGTTGEVGGLFAKAFHWFQFNKEEYLAHYHKRSNVESSVAMVKKKLGDAVKSKNELAQKNEVYAKFVAHNLMVLIAEMYALGIDAIFPAEATARPARDEPTILRFPTRL